MDPSDPGRNILRDETALHWGFLEDEPEACLIVSERMEVIYVNAAARRLGPEEWFGRRCYEVLPAVNDACALHCPTLRAVHETRDVVYCEETLRSGGESLHFGVGLVPLPAACGDRARAALLLRREDHGRDPIEFRRRLLDDARALQARIVSHFS
jgi:hypothetical protein